MHRTSVIVSTVVIAFCILLAEDSKAATLQNTDPERYEYKIISEGEDPLKNIYYGTIDDHATISICMFGCEITLLKTGQTIKVKPEEHIIIEQGILKRRKFP